MSYDQLKADLLTETRELREQLTGASEDLQVERAKNVVLANALRAAEDQLAERHKTILDLRQQVRTLGHEPIA